MIEIECDNCERTFSVGPEKAGGKVPCPHCNDVNRVPAQEPESSDRPPEGGPEKEICQVRPAMFRAHPFRYSLLVAIFLGGGVLTIWGVLPEHSSGWSWLGTLMIVAAVASWVVWFVGVHLWVKLSISNKRTIRQEGIIRRHTSEVLHDHVRNVEIKQSFFQRIFNVGYLGISSSGQDDIEIEARDLPKPYEIKALIDQYREM